MIKGGEVIRVAGQYQEFEQNKRLGILSFEQETLQRNRLVNQLVQIIRQEERSVKTSNSQLSSTSLKTQSWLKALGILGSLASIIGLWWVFKEPITAQPLQLTVFVTDQKGNVVLEQEGELNIPLGNRTLNATIGENGRTNFGDIPQNLKGTTIEIGLKAEGWELVDQDERVVFTGEPIKLQVSRDNSLGTVKGIVKSSDGQSMIQGARVLINSDTSVWTNEMGVFNLVLPEQMQVTNSTDRYLLTIQKEGYETKTQYHYPEGSDAEIRLTANSN